MLNSRRREATGAAEEYALAGGNNNNNNGGGNNNSNERFAAGPSALHDRSLRDPHPHDSYGGHGGLGPSLLERTPFAPLSLDFQPQQTQQQPLIQYDHDHDDDVLLRSGYSPKEGTRFEQSAQQQQAQQQQQQQQQSTSKFPTSSYLNYGGSSSHDYLDRVSSPSLTPMGNGVDGLGDHFAPNNAQQQQQQQQHQQQQGLAAPHHDFHAHNGRHASASSSVNLSGLSASGLSSRSSLSSYSLGAGVQSGRFSGALSPLSQLDTSAQLHSSHPQSRSSVTSSPPSYVTTQGSPNGGGVGLGGLSTQDLGWLKDEFQRAQQRDNAANELTQHAQQQQQQQQQQHHSPHPLLHSMHGLLPSSTSSNGGGSMHRPHHQRGLSNSAPGSTRASTHNVNDLSPTLNYETLVAQAQQAQQAQQQLLQQQQQHQQQQPPQPQPSPPQQSGASGGSSTPTSGGGSGIMDEMKLRKYKTVYCQRMVRTGGCRYGALCDFAHDRHELRRNLDLHWYYAVKCEKRHCDDQSCRYSHNDHEIMYHPRIYKTRLCSNFSKPGGCNRKMYCSFAHGKVELRFHANSNLLVGGPANLFGQQQPQQQQQQAQQTHHAHEAAQQAQVAAAAAAQQQALITAAMLPSQAQQQSSLQLAGQSPSVQPRATLTIAGGQSVLPRELVASLQASGISISASPTDAGQNGRNGQPFATTSAGVAKPYALLPSQQAQHPPQQQHLLHSQQQQAHHHLLAPSSSSVPGASPPPSASSSPPPSSSDASDAFTLGLGGHGHQHQQQQPASSPHAHYLLHDHHQRDGGASPDPLLSPHFAQLGLGVQHAAAVGAYAAAQQAQQPPASVSRAAMASPPSGVSTNESFASSAPSSTPPVVVAAGAPATAAVPVASVSTEHFREHTDSLKIRILDLVDEVAQLHFSRAMEEANAAAAAGQMLKVMTANLHATTEALSNTRAALAVYAGDEATMEGMSDAALDALAAHAAHITAAVAAAKAKRQAAEPSGEHSSSSGVSNGVSASPSACNASVRCLSCHDTLVSCLAWPCGHKVLCATCQVEQCPSCQASVTRIVPIINELPPLAPLIAHNHGATNSNRATGTSTATPTATVDSAASSSIASASSASSSSCASSSSPAGAASVPPASSSTASPAQTASPPAADALTSMEKKPAPQI